MLRDLPIDRLHARADARQINADVLPGLAESIAGVGLINPIRVRANGDGWEVIAGLHRLEACKSLGLVEIACDVVEDTDQNAELAKIDENVFRQELSPAERARDMARRKMLYDHVDGRSAHNSENLRNDRFTLHVAKVTGQSEATVTQQVSRGENILPEVIDLVAGTKLDSNTYLDELKRLPASEQYEAASRDLAQEKRALRVAASEEEHQMKALTLAWKKASKAVRQRFLEKVA